MAKNVLCTLGSISPQNAFVDGRIFNGGPDDSGFEGGRKAVHPQTRNRWWNRLPSDAHCTNKGQTKVLTKMKKKI